MAQTVYHPCVCHMDAFSRLLLCAGRCPLPYGVLSVRAPTTVCVHAVTPLRCMRPQSSDSRAAGSVTCQRRDWSTHKGACAVPTASAATASKKAAPPVKGPWCLVCAVDLAKMVPNVDYYYCARSKDHAHCAECWGDYGRFASVSQPVAVRRTQSLFYEQCCTVVATTKITRSP